jgi:hypothetical protein
MINSPRPSCKLKAGVISLRNRISIYKAARILRVKAIQLKLDIQPDKPTLDNRTRNPILITTVKRRAKPKSKLSCG